MGLIKLALDLTDLLSNIIHSHLFLPQKLLHWPIALLVRVCWSVQAQIWLFFGLIIRRKRHDNDLPKSQGRGIAA